MKDMDKNKIRRDRDFEQCKNMMQFTPDAASMYIEVIAQRTGFTEKEIAEFIKSEI